MRLFSLILLFIFCSCSSKGELDNYFYPEEEQPQEIKNDLANSLYGEGNINLEKSNFNLALFFFKRSLELEENTIIYNSLGITEKYRENIDKSIEYHKKGIDLDTTYPQNYINIAISYIYKEDYLNSELILKKLLDNTTSEYWKAYTNLYLAAIYTKTQDCRLVEKHLLKAQELEKDEVLGAFYRKTKNIFESNCK